MKKEDEDPRDKKKNKKVDEDKIYKALDDVIIRSGDYRIQIQVLEAKDIMPNRSIGNTVFGNKQGSCDPLVEVDINGDKKRTDYVPKTNNPIFNETLYFELPGVSELLLHQTVIELSLYDHNIFTSNDFIGKFTVDAAYIYQLNSDHELYRKWVVLTDTTDVTEGVRGYLRVTINVLGPGDRPPVHDERKDLKIKDDAGENHIFSPGHIDKT